MARLDLPAPFVLSRIADEINDENIRAMAALNALTGRIDELTNAALQEDWDKVRRLGAVIAKDDKVTYPNPGVRTAVEYVRDAMKETDTVVFRDRINTLMRRTSRFRACSGQTPYSG